MRLFRSCTSILTALAPILFTWGCAAQNATEPETAPQPEGLSSETAASPAEDLTAKTETAGPETRRLTQGSRLHLWLPEDVKRFSRALLYRNADASLVVAVAELTAPNGDTSGMIKGIVQGTGDLTLVSEEKRNESRRLYLEGKRSGKDARMVVLEGSGVAATVYVLASPERKVAAEKILDSVTLETSAPLDPLKIHGLRLARLGNMVVGNTTHQPVLLTRKGQKPPIPPTSAIAFISVNPHNFGAAITDEQLFSLVSANTSNLHPNFEEAKINESKIAGRKAREFLLRGQKDETPLAIYAYAIEDGDCVIVAVAYVQLDRADKEFSDVVPLLRSLQLDAL